MTGPLANDPAARIFHTLLLAYLVWTSLELALVPVVAVRKATVALIQFCLVLTLIGSLYLLRKGLNRLGGFVYLCGSGALNLIALVFGGGLHSPVVAVYTMLPISAAWLLGYRAMVWVTAVFLGSSLLLTILQLNGFFQWTYFPMPPFAAWLVTVEAVVVGVVPVAQTLKILKERLVRSEAERAALQASEERFRRVFEEGPLGFALVGKDYRFRDVNRAFSQMVGYDEAALSQMSFIDITHPDDVRADVELAEKLFRREIPFYRIQKRYVKKNGEIIWIHLTASVIRGPDDEPLDGLAMIENITEIKRIHEEALLSQKLESVGTLAGGIAHDFNNLLGAVQAQAELALVELDAGSSCKEELNAIREVAMRGAEIVRQLMIYAGKENTVVELVDVSTIVEEMLSLLKVSVTKHVVIEANLDRHLPVVRASSAQIRQIVMNLITNASDAIGDRDGIIRVITRRLILNGESASMASITLPNGAYVQLDISDTGRGMSAETQAKAFDPFFTSKSAGRGLGLAVVQGLVRSLGGTVVLTSELNQGSTFQVLLPCTDITDGASGHAVSSAGELAMPSPRGKILVVEDEDQLRQPLVKMLRKAGFEVFEAADGSSAIDLLQADGGKLDVILLDITIPGASSDEVVAQAANAKPDIKVILTSAYSREMIANTMIRPEIHSFIRKPFRFDDLLMMLRSCLPS